MPNFNVHIAAGLIVGFIFAYFLYSFVKVSILVVTLGFIISVLSAGFPDIDHERSMPRKIMRAIVPGLVAILAIYYFFSAKLWQQNWLIIVGLIAICVGFVFSYEKFIPEHRGATHKLPGLIFVALFSALIGLFLGLGFISALILSIFSIFGFSTHVLLDYL